jgi:pimeloyl-ACP methyl ester carboxylesterase
VQNDDDHIEGLTMMAPEKGGDLGSPVARIMAALYPRSVKALLLNFAPAPPPKSFLHAIAPRLTQNCIPSAVGTFVQNLLSPFIAPMTTFGLKQEELMGVKKANKFTYSRRGYSAMHATRPSTIAHAIASSPVALLAWIGEKFLEWSDEPPSMDTILSELTLYWLTSSFETTIYPYREVRR